MKQNQNIRRIACVLAGLAALVTVSTAPAFAMVPGSGGSEVAPRHLVPVHAVVTVLTGGMRGWQIAVIAVSAAVIAATFAVLVDRAWTTRRRAITIAA
jgi:hypothetical protein